MFATWELDLIAECRAGRLVTIAKDGLPRPVPVCYAFFEGRFWVPVDEKPKRHTRLARLADLERDPRCVLLIDRYEDDWNRLAWVRVECRGVVLDRGESEARALEALRARYHQYETMDLEGLPLVALEPRAVRGWRWQDGANGG